uniref:hydroxypyruvate isomerase n=1 Tax=Castellaniella defragrans TaxID=75697 RepID=UPI00333FC4EE
MPRFAANLSMLFPELDFLDRFQAAAQAGFKGVEFQFPYAYAPQALAARLRDHDLTLVLHNMPAGDWDGGERGIACHPDRIQEFRDGVDHAIDYATALGCPQVNCLAGKVPSDTDAAQARRIFIDNLRYAAPRLASAGIRLLIEPINTYDIPGFLLNRTDQALAILDEVDSPNLLVQYDIYHAQRTEGELAATISRHLARIGHIQIADNPGRHEPGTGEIHYPWLLRHIDRAGYQGWIGCEYKPAGDTRDGLAWRQAMNA